MQTEDFGDGKAYQLCDLCASAPLSAALPTDCAPRAAAFRSHHCNSYLCDFRGYPLRNYQNEKHHFRPKTGTLVKKVS